MSEGRRGGERRQHTQQSVCTLRRHKRLLPTPRGRVLRSVLRPVHVNPRYALQAQASEAGHPRQHRGRANLRKQEEPAPGLSEMNGARLATSHRSRKGDGVRRPKKRKEVEASVPARIEELGFGCPHVETQLQKSVSDVRSRISSANALQKERSGSSERGPSSSQTSAGETVGGCGGRKDDS
jgi:hypothetical protein